MKKSVMIMGIVAMMAAMTGCENGKDLAEQLTGQWAGNTDKLIDQASSSSTILETYTFTRTDSVENGGNVTIASLLSVTGAIDGTSGINVPISLTAGGYATVEGTWQAVSGDKVVLHLNTGSLKVKVDPEAVLLTVNNITGGDTSTTEALKPQLAKSIESQMIEALAGRYPSEVTLSGVSIRDGMFLKAKDGKKEVELSRQNS